jgi:hypothetical protein
MKVRAAALLDDGTGNVRIEFEGAEVVLGGLLQLSLSVKKVSMYVYTAF